MPKPTSRKSGWQTSIWQTFLAGAIVAAVAVGGSSALAASGSWRGTTNASWATTGNWSGASPPTTSELATFNGAGNGNTTIDLGSGVTVRSLVFDSANAAAYTIGSGAVGSQTLTLGDVGYLGGLFINSAVTNSQVINANVTLGTGAIQSYYLTNSSPSAGLTIAGNVTGGAGTGNKTFYIGGAGNTTISGTIGRGSATTLALNKTGAGTLTLSGSNTYNSATTLNQGTINLDFSAATAPAANILSSSGGALSLTGGTLRLTGKASTANSQAVASTTVGSGNSALVLNANSATSLLLNLNAISRSAGGTLDLSLPTGTQNNTNGVITSSTANLANSVLVSAASNGIAYATVGGSDWATISGSNIVAMTTYQTAYSANNNVNVANGDTPASGITVNTLRFNGNNTLNLSGTNTVNTGGILVTNAATTGATISGGTLISGGGRELVLINNGAQFTVGSVIANNGANAAALTLSGTGTTVLNGVNTYTGATNINGGRVRLGSSQALGVNSTVTLSNNASSILDLNGNNVTINGLVAQGMTMQADTDNGRFFELSSASVNLGSNTLTVGSGNATSVFGGTLAGTGELVKVGTGRLTLNGDNTGFTGNVTIKAGTVLAGGGSGNNNALGTGTVTLGDSAGGSNNATLGLGGATNAANAVFNYYNNVVLAPLTTGTLTISRLNGNDVTRLWGTITGSNSVVLRGSGGGSWFNNTINNSGNLTFDMNFANLQTSGGAIGSNVQNVTISGGGNGSTFNWTGSINNSGTITNNQSSGNQATIGGVIGPNVTGLVQNSPVGLTLNSANTFAGNSLVQSGTLTLGDNLALQNSGLDTSGAGVINATNRTTPTFGGLIGSKDIANVITTGYGAITALTLNPQSGRSYTYSGIIGNGSGSTTLTKSGSGTQVLSGSNTYTGATTVTAGLLAAGSDALSGQNGAFGNATSAILVGNTAASSTGTAGLLASAAVTIGRNVTVQSLGASGAQTAILGGSLTSGTAAFTGNITLSRAVTLQAATGGTVDFSTGTWTTNNNGISVGTTGNDGTVRIANALGGSGGLTLNNGNLVLTASNAFSGATTLNAGTLAFDRVTALNSSSGIGVAAGSILDYTGTTAGTLSRNVTVSSSGTGTIRNSGGQKLTLSGTLTKDGRVLRLTGGQFDVTGQIVGASANSDLLVDGTSTVTLLAANTYNGPTFVNQASTLVLGTNNAIPNNSIVTLGDATTRGTLDLGGFTDAINQLVFSGSGGTVRMAANQTASPQLSSTSSLTLGSNASLDLTGMQTSAGLYRLISSTGLSGTFASVTGLDSNYLLRYGTVNTNEVTVQRKAEFGTITATPASATIITGGSTAFGYTVANATPTGGSTLSFTSSNGSNVAGVSSGSAGANTTSSSISGLVFTGTSVGLGQTGSFTLTDPNAIGSPVNGTVTVSVLNHSLASFAGTDSATKTLNFGTYDAGSWSGGDGGNGTVAYSIFNIASLGFTDAQTAGLDLYDWTFTSGDNVFGLGLTAFQNLASGTSNGFFASVLSPGELADRSYSGTYTLRFRDVNLPGGTNTRDLALTMNVIVVPEPGAIALAGIGIAAAAYAARSRSSSRKRAG